MVLFYLFFYFTYFFILLIIVVVIIVKNSNLSTDGMEEGLGPKALIVILLPKNQKKYYCDPICPNGTKKLFQDCEL